jgi:hypothetical protein
MPRHTQIVDPFQGGVGSDLTSDTVDLRNTRGWSYSVLDLRNTRGWSYSVRTLAEGTSAITLELSIDGSNWSVNEGYHQVPFDLELGPPRYPFARFLRNSAVTVTAAVNLVEG